MCAKLKGKHGIYKITSNIKQNKCYIGSAVCLCNRKSVHFKLLKDNKHFNKPLQNHYNKYGKDDLKFNVVEYIENKENLIEREQFWIDSYDFDCLFNIRKIADSNIGIDRKGEKAASWGRKGEKAGFYGKKHKRVICEYCNKSVPVNIANIFHFDNCLENPNVPKEDLINRRKKSKETRLKLSDIASKRTGNKNPMYGKKLSKEHKKIISENAKIRHKNKEKCIWCNKMVSDPNKTRFHFDNCLENPKNDKEKLKETRKLNHPNFGKKFSKSLKNKISEAAKKRSKLKCPYCNKICDISNAKKWHFDNCKENPKNNKKEIEKKRKLNHPKYNKNQKIVKCPHCGKEGGNGAMMVWHFDKCKYKK